MATRSELSTLDWGLFFVICSLCVPCDRPVQPDEVFLNLVLEYFPETLYRIERHHSKAKNIIATVQTKVSGAVPPL
jgi:hypothetical protein